MTDQASNALSILSYFSSLLDPIAPSTDRKQSADEIPRAPRDPLPESSKSSTPSSSPTKTPVPLSLDDRSLLENFRPLLIGLKLPISLAGAGNLSTNISRTSLTAASPSIDSQTFFFINPVIAPGKTGGEKKDCKEMGQPPTQTSTSDGGSQRAVVNEPWRSVRSSSAPLTCPSEQSAGSIKSENVFSARNGSDQNGSTNSSPSWRESGEESIFQFPPGTFAFSSVCDTKRYLEEIQQQNLNSFDFATEDRAAKTPDASTPGSSAHPGALPTGLQSVAGNIGNAIREEKVCAVCGDRALGCNFDAVSCESCKAFFRRNAFKEQKIKCLFDGCCQISVNTRRFCSYCRLKQCFAAGMKKHFILGVEEKKRRMEVVRLNRKRRSEEVESSTNSSTAAAANTQATSSDSLHGESTNLLTLARLDPLTSTSSSSSAPATSQSTDSQLVRKLTAEESHMLIDLNQVYDLSFTVDLEPLIHITQLNPSLNQLVNQSSYTVLRLIKFAKRLDDFVKLSQDLQISILKGCWFHLLLLRPVSLFDAERDGWVTPKGVIPTDILKNATGYVQLHDDHVRYCRSIKSIIGNDIMLLVILLVLVLFAPDGPHVVAREVISNIQDRYVVLLKHYLEAKYTFKRSAHMFPQLLEKIRELNSLVDNHAKILMDINPQEIEPIMLEMLDL